MPASNDKHHLLRTFCSVVHCGSFSQAAAFLGIPASSVSKHVKQLEQQLKTPLLIRNTRSMKLTDAGTICYEEGRKILQHVEDLEQQIQSLTHTSQGKLRVSLPLMIGEQVLTPLLCQFMAENPGIRLELDFSHQPTDLVAQDVDIVFRTASALPDSALFEIKLMALQPIYVASPEYLNRRGTPSTLGDLVHHNRLVFRTDIHGTGTHWPSGEQGQSANRVVSNSYQSLITAACAGTGIACVYDVLVVRELADNTLVQVLTQHQPPGKCLSILYRQRQQTSQKIHAFIEFFRHHPVIKSGQG